MPAVPSGRLTFVFTDIEGSTQLWERHPAAMRLALARHDEIVRGAIEGHHGYVFKTVGDAFCAAFESAQDALAAVVAVQRALSSEAWPAGLTRSDARGRAAGIRVRAGLHAGEAEERDGDYFGPVVNRAARLMAAAHGGQVVLSQTVFDLLADSLGGDLTLRDMGLRRLRDLSLPEHIYQVIVPGLPAEFPPLKTLDARPNNLPAQLTTLVGREHEISAIEALLLRGDVRLVTLIGAGGTGKTRVGLQVGANLIDVYEHGVYFIPLASIGDPNLMLSTISGTLGLREEGTRSPLDTLCDYLRDKRMLLILDNFEQLLPAAPHLADLLAQCPHLTMLVTSRSLLRLHGEREYEILPLSVPDLADLPPAEHCLDYDAVRLFVERAQSVQDDFKLTSKNRRAVAEICVRLDGLPLAIELAAARIKLMAPDALLMRLSSRLKTLTGGARDLPARQQTIRNTIAWSHDLLAENERVIFRRLSVFTGGFTLDAAEAVCDAMGQTDTAVLDGVASLADKSLLRRIRRPRRNSAGGGANWEDERAHAADAIDADPRFLMLETIREYAQIRLVEAREVEAAREAHAAFFSRMAEDAGPQIDGPQADAWLEFLDVEHDNLRLALDWYQAVVDGDHLQDGLKMAAALWHYWYFRGYWIEGRARLEALLDLALDRTPARASALSAAGVLAYGNGDDAAAQRFEEEASAIFKEIGDKPGASWVLYRLGMVFHSQGDYPSADATFRECLALFRELGDTRGIGTALHSLGEVALAQGRYRDARSFYEQAQAQAGGHKQVMSWALFSLGVIAYYQYDLAAARSWSEQTLRMAAELGDKHVVALARASLGLITAADGDPVAGRDLLEQSRQALQELDARRDVAMTLNALGALMATQQCYDTAHAYFSDAVTLARGIGARPALAEGLAGMAREGLASGRFDLGAAMSLMRESLALRRDLGDQRGVADSLDGFAELACVRAAAGEAESIPAAAQWLGGADALRESIGATVWPVNHERYTHVVESVRAMLGEPAFAEAWDAGRAASLPDLIQGLLHDMT
ncbi:MAG: tetratricopeptide repeat protein [Anaerolineae bacterium]